MNAISEELRVKSEKLAQPVAKPNVSRPFLKLFTLHSSLFTSVSGFSLVEVMLAVGVVALAVVGILTAFPVGLEAARDSRDENTAALIADQIFTQLRSQDFTKVKVPRVPVAQWDLRTKNQWSGTGPNYTDMFFYDRSGQPANAVSGGTPGDRPGAGSGYKSDEGYFGVMVHIKRNPYDTYKTDTSICNMTEFAGVRVMVSWPARQPYTNRKFQRNFDSTIAYFH